MRPASDGDAWAKSFGRPSHANIFILYLERIARRPSVNCTFLFDNIVGNRRKNIKRICKKRWRSGHARRNHCTRQCVCEKYALNGTATTSINYNWFQLILQLFLFLRFCLARRKSVLLILNMHKHDYGTDVSLPQTVDISHVQRETCLYLMVFAFSRRRRRWSALNKTWKLLSAIPVNAMVRAGTPLTEKIDSNAPPLVKINNI